MLSTTGNQYNQSSSAIDAILDLEQRIQLLDQDIAPLLASTKKLKKIESKLNETNLLIESSIGSKDDKAALRKTKRNLRERRIQLWEKLEVLPSLEEERANLQVEVAELRRRHGIMTS